MPHPNYACLACLAGPVAPFPESGIRAEFCSTKAGLAPLIGHVQAFSIEKDGNFCTKFVEPSNVREWQAQYLDGIREANMRSPHGRAPPEILGKNFVACIDEENMLVPFNLARVCSRWRSVALGTLVVHNQSGIRQHWCEATPTGLCTWKGPGKPYSPEYLLLLCVLVRFRPYL
ncbi:hypothetical protein BD779DRAFT_715587 [Infundibulicybe gibba]|nr:hypothetical protein BD779DRAFT_715587 [Infundibulicybe gibba]